MATAIPLNSAEFSAGEAARLTSGRLVDVSPEARCGGVTTDSRRVRPQDCFVALRGEKHNARRFVHDAAQRGAAFSLVESESQPNDLGPHIAVEDSLVALGELARAHRRRWGGRVIGITGSVGKTTTKEITAAALSGALVAPVARTEGNLNNRVGLPHTLLALNASSRHAVVEAGTSAPGEIACLVSIAEPDVGVVTRVAMSHVEGLGSLEAVADEKTALLRGVRSNGVRVINGDDERLEARVDRKWPRVIRFGVGPNNDVRVSSGGLDDDLRTEVVVHTEHGQHTVRLHLLGDAACMALAAAAAILIALDVDLAAYEAGLSATEQVAALPGRMHLLRRRENGVVLDDSYNASPTSMRHALQTAVKVGDKRRGKVVAVLGDMLELGTSEADAHREILEHASSLPLRGLVTVGDRFQFAAAQLSSDSCCTYGSGDFSGALARIEELARPGDIVVVKGSRSMRMERFVQALRAGDEGRAS